MTIQVVLPAHLRTLARVGGAITLELQGEVSAGAILDELEARHPELRGTIRDQVTHRRRPFLRFFACGRDVSLDPSDSPLPAAIADGTEPFLIVGAMAGG